MRLSIEVDRASVDAECQRRILARYSIVDQLNAPYEGREADMREWIEAMRERCREIKRVTPVPHDFSDDRWWQL